MKAAFFLQKSLLENQQACHTLLMKKIWAYLKPKLSPKERLLNSPRV